MIVYLNWLKIKNFKGITNFEMDLKGRCAVISGRNAAGKTTIADAFYFLMDGATLDQRATFNILRFDDIGRVIDKNDAMVEAELVIDDNPLKLKKIYKQIWKKPRGKSEQVLSGHTTEHYIDDVPVSAREYQSEINQTVDAQFFRTVSDVKYFCQTAGILDRRALLFDFLDDINDDDIIDSNESLKGIKGIFGRRTPEACKKLLKNRRKETEKEILEYHVRIDELRKSSPDISELNESGIRTRLVQIKEINVGGDIIKRLAELDAELIGLTSDIRQKYQLMHDELTTDKNDFLEDIRINRQSLQTTELNMKQLSVNFKNNNVMIQNLKKKWVEVNASSFVKTSRCYVCNQVLPDEMIAKAEDAYNQNKADELKKINTEGQKLRSEIDSLSKEIDSQRVFFTELQDIIIDRQKKIEVLDKKIAENDDAMQKEIIARRQLLEDQIYELKQQNEKSADYKIEEERAELESMLLDIVQVEKNKRKIKQHKKKLKQKSRELEQIEHEFFLLEEFERKKAEYIEAGISDKFESADWRLFEIQINGNMKDICEPYYKGVPYSELNTGAKINVGLDVIKTLSHHLDLQCPIFIDNAESITGWPDFDGQLIKLTADPDQEELNIHLCN